MVTAAPDDAAAAHRAVEPGGRLVVPVGPEGGRQSLLVLEKQPDGRTVTRSLLGVRFVPLTRER